MEESLDVRLKQIENEIDTTGTYIHTFSELKYGACLAWRNNSRCIGRIQWRNLEIFDRRSIKSSEEAFRNCIYT